VDHAERAKARFWNDRNAFEQQWAIEPRSETIMKSHYFTLKVFHVAAVIDGIGSTPP
jgi:hypothetical protein